VNVTDEQRQRYSDGVGHCPPDFYVAQLEEERVARETAAALVQANRESYAAAPTVRPSFLRRFLRRP
jgi:hypothetical protein